jgi:hypothetical protein
MPLPERRISVDRVDFRGALSTEEVDELASDMRVRVLQASEPAPQTTWNLLNERFFARRPDVQLRLYAHYAKPCDLTHMSAMTNVRHFAADCLQTATSVETISELKRLISLSVGIFSLKSFDFLADLDASALTDLSLHATRSKRPSLGLIERFGGINRLHLEGQQKDIDVIRRLKNIEQLTLRSVTLDSLALLRELPKLWSLNIKLGGCSNLAALSKLENIKYLELWQILRLDDLAPVSEMTGLQFLFLQSLKRVTHLPNFSALTRLRRIHIENMRGLKSLAPLLSAPALGEVVCVDASNLDPKEFEILIQGGRLKRLAVGLGSDRKNTVVSEMMREHGIEPFKFTPFAWA